MALFDAKLGEKQQLVVYNKMDIPDAAERWPEIEKELKERGYESVCMSAATGNNIRPILWKLYEMVQNAPAEETESEENLPLYTPEDDPRRFTIDRNDMGDYVVRGTAIERAAKMTYWEHSGSLRRFQNLLRTLGIEDALRDAGIENGDTVIIGDDFELEWVE